MAAQYERLRQDVTLNVIEWNSPQHRALKPRFRASTGKTLPDGVPLFWVEGSSTYTTGREWIAGQDFNVLGVISWVLKQVASLIVGRIRDRRAGTPESPSGEGAPVPISSALDDESAITLGFLLAKEDIGFKRGMVRRLELKAATGPLRRLVDNAIGQKVKIAIVSERLTPARYEAVVKALDTTVDRFGMFVLIEKRPVGLFKGIRRKVVEKIAVGKLKDAPIDIVFERAHKTTYDAVINALAVAEPGQKPTSPGGESDTPTASLPPFVKEMLLAAVADRLKASQDNKAAALVLAEIERRVKSKLDGDDNEKSWTEGQENWNSLGILGLILAAGGYGARRLKKRIDGKGETE